MPEDSKKNQQKAKHDPKEQRRPRQRNQLAPAAVEKNVDRKVENKTKDKPKNFPVKTKPVYEDPGPEFYKGLKRETDEIMKLTEEANLKYKKKEIQSNWAKYEMPIDSYEDMEEQENMGADYETLIEAPLSIGGHFQFKHEKSWDLNTGPSLYDNYFDINMDNVATALSTIPFYERNSIEKSLFSQTDITNMDNRSKRYKQKYYNDKSFTTPELEAQDKSLATLKECFQDKNEVLVRNEEENIENKAETSLNNQDIVLEKPTNFNKPKHYNKVVKHNKNKSEKEITISIPEKSIGELSLGNKDIHDDFDDILSVAPVDSSLDENVDLEAITQKYPQQASSATKDTTDLLGSSTLNLANPPVMESPEDLEKWLDNFLES